MDNKKRRYKSNHPMDYHPRYKAHSREDRNWRPENFRDDNRFHHRQGSGHGVNRSYQDSEPFSCDIEIQLIGRKMKDPMIHVCEICSLPIRSYGRMIPCKHVFCFSCAKKTDNNCPRCKDGVQRIEQCPLGSVWLCAVSNNCKRTYLSQRDLQAHVNHRHSKPIAPASAPPILPHPLVLPPANVVAAHPPITVPPPPLLQRPEQYLMVSAPHSVAAPAPMSNVGIPPTTPVNATVSARPSSNLITIQIQDDQANVAPTTSFPPPPPPRRPHNQPQLVVPQNRDPPPQPRRY